MKISGKGSTKPLFVYSLKTVLDISELANLQLSFHIELAFSFSFVLVFIEAVLPSFQPYFNFLQSFSSFFLSLQQFKFRTAQQNQIGNNIRVIKQYLQMATFARRRLLQDLLKIQKSNNTGIQAIPNQDNIFSWDSFIEGPEETIWEGGVFRLKITFAQDYPNNPPKIVFVSKMFHPNIYNDGNICLDILQKNWSPMYDIQALLTSIRSLLSDPNPDSPANQQAAQMYSNNRSQYEKRVKQIVELSWVSKITIQQAQEA